MRKKYNNKIAIIQPAYPHYRKEFFLGLEKLFSIDYFQVNRRKDNSLKNITDFEIKKLKSFNILKAVFFIFPISYFFKYKVIVITGEFKYITNWFILLFAKLTNTKVLIWWHGVNWRKRINDIENLPFITKLFGKLSTGMFLYTEKEKIIWEKYINKNKIFVLNNSIDTKTIIKNNKKHSENKLEFKEKHNITQANILIFSARFSNPYRNTDKMIEFIENLDSTRYGFIIIGDGDLKPDFNKYNNVYDYGALYDEKIKTELFIIADLYFQLGAIGLSIIEAMAYGLPILTLERSEQTKHGVEYGYLKHNYNSYLAKDISDIEEFVNLYFNKKEFQNKLKDNSLSFIKDNINIENMINNAESAFKHLLNE